MWYSFRPYAAFLRVLRRLPVQSIYVFGVWRHFFSSPGWCSTLLEIGWDVCGSFSLNEANPDSSGISSIQAQEHPFSWGQEGVHWCHCWASPLRLVQLLITDSRQKMDANIIISLNSRYRSVILWKWQTSPLLSKWSSFGSQMYKKPTHTRAASSFQLGLCIQVFLRTFFCVFNPPTVYFCGCTLPASCSKLIICIWTWCLKPLTNAGELSGT